MGVKGVGVFDGFVVVVVVVGFGAGAVVGIVIELRWGVGGG